MSFNGANVQAPKRMVDAYLQGVDSTRCFEFDNGHGRPMIARLLSPGDPYGRDGCLTWGADLGTGIQDPVSKAEFQEEFGKKPGVEFYDATHKADPRFGPLGQFVSRYYLNTLVDDRDVLTQRGLCLDGGVPEWGIQGEAFAKVLAWAESVVGSKPGRLDADRPARLRGLAQSGPGTPLG